MNMQNKVYTTQFFSPPNDRFTAWIKKYNFPPREDSNSQKTKKPIAFCPLAKPHS